MPKTTKQSGAEQIALERQRQIYEGWTEQHDDGHEDESLALAAVCYAAPERIYVKEEFAASVSFKDPWPWDHGFDKRHYPGHGNVVAPQPNKKKRIRELVKAGALIAAEIDRLQRSRRRPWKG
jgi:hypothetical protein